MRSEKQNGRSRTAILLFFPLVVLLLSSCSFLGWSTDGPIQTDPVEKGSGAMLLRHKAWLYRIGGLDGSGEPSAVITLSTIDEDGKMGELIDTATLPVGIRNGVVLAAGNLMYVIGGRNEEGLVSTIYFTLIHADGTLGFGSDEHWESNPRPLPEGRASAAWVLRDGWIYVIGGLTPSGPTNSIIRARIYQDGQIGHWYDSRETLPAALWGATSTVLGDRLYIAGGVDSHSLSTGMLSFAFGSYGALSDRRIEPDLPTALQKAILLADGDDLILIGGYGDAGWSSDIYQYHDRMWSNTSVGVQAEGPYYGRSGGMIYYLSHQIEECSGVGKLEGLSLAPDVPTLLPGSGTVPVRSPILVASEPGTTIRYRTDGENPTASDEIWPSTLMRVTSETLPTLELSLAAFAPDGTRSPVIHRAYRIRANGLFIMIEGTLPIHGSDYTDLDHYILQASGEEDTATSTLWYRMRIDTAGNYRLSWADADENPLYSARVALSVYEADLYTEVPDLNGVPVYDRREGLASPLQLLLGRGDYFMHIRDIDGQEGSDFGLSLMRD